jgi:hypothetical protein
MNHRLNNNKNNHLMTATASTTTTFALGQPNVASLQTMVCLSKMRMALIE